MEIEAKLESIDSKIDSYNTKIENLSSLITTLIHSFQQNQLPSLKTEILNKLEEKFSDSSSFPDVDEMKKVFAEIKDDFYENQNGLKLRLVELDTAIDKFSAVISNASADTFATCDENIHNQLNNIENILNSLSDEIKSFRYEKQDSDFNANDFPTEKINEIASMLTVQNQANSDFLFRMENHFTLLEENLAKIELNNTSSHDDENKNDAKINDSFENINIEGIKKEFDYLSLSMTSVLSAIKIVDKKYEELKGFQNILDKLTTDVVSPILLASSDIKAFLEKTTDNFDKLNAFVQEYDTEALRNIQNQISDVNIDVTKLLDLVNEFKTNSDLSNHAISDNMEKFEKMLSDYNDNLAELTQSATTEVIKDGVKSLNDEFYLELLNLFNSLSFDAEAEDIKDFIENVLQTITVKTDENSEKLNNIMMQFKNLFRKVEGIERTQNSISDYLKPEESDNLMYSFDDIQSDLAKMRLTLNEISKSVNTSGLVDEISEKIRQTNEQIEHFSQTLYSNPNDNTENVLDIKEKIETLNSQVYDISLRTNKLILSNEDSTNELKNNLEIFKDVFEKANPEKLYELFYELTNYFNDVIERINYVSQTSKEALSENATIKNALVYVGEWLDSATNVLEEIRDNSVTILNGEVPPSQLVVNDNNFNTTEINDSLIELKKSIEDNLSGIFAKIDIKQQDSSDNILEIKENLSEVFSKISIQQQNLQSALIQLKENCIGTNENNTNSDFVKEQFNVFENNLSALFTTIKAEQDKMNKFKTLVDKNFAELNKNMITGQQELQNRMSAMEEKLDKLLKEKASSKGLTPTQNKNINAKFENIQEILNKISESLVKE